MVWEANLHDWRLSSAFGRTQVRQSKGLSAAEPACGGKPLAAEPCPRKWTFGSGREFRPPNLSFPPRLFLFKNSFPFHSKSSKTLKHLMKTWFYPSRGLRHPRFHRTVGIPIPESSRVLHSPPLKNIRPRMFLN